MYVTIRALSLVRKSYTRAITELPGMKETLALLEKVRDHYLQRYRSALAEFMEQNRPSAPEVLFELPRPECAYAFRLYRADMAST